MIRRFLISLILFFAGLLFGAIAYQAVAHPDQAEFPACLKEWR